MVARANFGNWVYNNVDAGNGTTRYVYNTAGGGGFLSNIKSDYSQTGFYYPQFQSSYYVQNASFVKMDNMGLIYNYGKIWGRSNLKLSVNCQNVFVITKYTGIDPEVYGGIDNNIYPRPRNFTVGASVNF
jgi:iron complex outermembrane receptor protein